MPEQAVDAAAALGGKVDSLAASVDQLTASFNRSQKAARRWRWLTVSIVVVSVVTLGLVVAVVVNVRYSAHQAACVQAYTNQNADRNNAIFPYSQAKNDAQDDFVTALAAGDRKASNAAFAEYVRTVRAYKAAQNAHPLPAAPHITC